VTDGTRHLRAIVFTDVVGFTRLGQRDEPGALRKLETYRGLLRSLFPRYSGREVKTMGDGFLVEFESALEATEWAVESQRQLFQHNRRPNADPIEVRIGIHLGDVIHKENDVYGDAVNVASRIEPLAEASGICVSGPVADQVRNKVPYGFTPLDHPVLKNVETPFAVYSIDLPWVAPPAARITPWTDRDAELRSVQHVLREVAGGKGQVVALSGESGIGKTRLAEQAIRDAEQNGFRSVRGRAHQDEQPVPHSLWVQLIRSVARDAPAPLLYKVCTGCDPELGKLVPELHEFLTPRPTLQSDDSEQARLRLFEAIARFFANLAGESPLVLLLDDLQWADPGSLRVLAYLAETISTRRTLLLLTYRDTVDDENPILHGVVEEFARQRLLARIPVKRMEGSPAEQLVAAVLGTPSPPAELVQVARQKTGGNPLFVEELIRSLVEERQLVRSAAGWVAGSLGRAEVPSTLREVILKRVGRAGPEAQRVLSAASVLGDEFEFDVLREVSGEEAEPLLEQLESLLRARLLREREVAAGRSVYLFADDRTREVLYRELSLIRRQRYHLRSGRVLEARHGERSEEIAGELSLHYRRGGDLPRALAWTVVAGRCSRRLYAREQAVTYFREALEILEAAPDPLVRAGVLEELGEEFETLGRYDESARSRREAAELYEQVGDRRRAGAVLGRVAIHSQWTQLGEFRVDETALQHARTLLEAVPPSPELARLYLDYAAYVRASGRLGDSRSLLARALEVAQASGDPTLEATVRLDLADHLPLGAREEVKHAIDRAIELGRLHNPSIAVEAYYRRVHFAATGYADMAEAESWIAKGVEYSRSVNAPEWEAAFTGSIGAFTSMWNADVDLSVRRTEEYQRFLSEHGKQPSAHILMHLALGPLVHGDVEEAARVLGVVKQTLATEKAWYQDAWYNFCLAWLEVARRNFAEAEKFYLRALDADRPRGATEYDGFRPIWFLSGAIDCAARLHAVDRLEKYLAELEPVATRVGGSPARAYLTRARGLQAVERGELVEGASLLRESAALWRELAWPRELALTCLEWAKVEVRSGHGDHARAPLAEAIEIFRAQTARLDLEDALDLQREAAPGSKGSTP
jgi:class 3 adenylate cyclase/tetratricopeptide (TPR) repeat protein